jgi:site-specific DNA-cytosine methylase
LLHTPAPFPQAGLIVDNFAGGGGASTGIEQALGRAVDIAINHDEEAIRMHEVNHPGTRHIRNNIWQIDPLEVTGGQPVALAWFSPDCKHFSKAKGGKPREKSIRDLAWVVVLWGKRARPDVILLENVEEFRTWGPLDDEGSRSRRAPARRSTNGAASCASSATGSSSASCAPATMARRPSASASS